MIFETIKNKINEAKRAKLSNFILTANNTAGCYTQFK